MDGQISARRGRVGPQRCRAMGSSTPLAIVIATNPGHPRTADTTTINGRNVAKCRHLYVTLPSVAISAIPEMRTELAAAVTSGDLQAVNALFKRLKDKGLPLNKNKPCQLGEPSITFLGHVVDSRGISIPTYRVEAIKRFPVPTTLKELVQFL